jgi:hypothetical protein
MGSEFASVEWAAAIQAAVLVVVSLALCGIGRAKGLKIKRRRRSQKLTLWVDGQRYLGRTRRRPSTTTIARLGHRDW